MYLMNEKQSDSIDLYTFSFGNLQYVIEKFKELSAASNIDLNNEFIYRRQHNGYIVHDKTALTYPISTLLLASQIPYDLNGYVSKDVASNIYSSLAVYSPGDLYAIYEQIKDDSNIDSATYEYELEDALKDKYKDIFLYRTIFKKLSFKLVGTYNVGEVVRYVRGTKKNVIQSTLFNNYMAANMALCNTEVLKLLQLTPNRIN